MNNKNIVPVEIIKNKILLSRGQKVLLDKDLADLYNVETRNLNKAVARNISRFPRDFRFRLTHEEFDNLKFHFGTSSWGGTRKLPYAFTEQGVAMLSSVLRSERAVQVNIAIMRTFVKLREILTTNNELAEKLNELELKIDDHDDQISSIFEAIKHLLEPDNKKQRKIGFDVKKKKVGYAAE